MEILKQFGINPILLLAQVVNFAILLFILKRFLYKPLLKVLAQRKQKIEESLKNAEEIEKRLLETNEKIDKMFASAAVETQKMRDELKGEKIALLEETKQASEKLAAEIIKKGEETARAESQRLEREVMSKVSEIVIVALEKVIGKQITKEEQRKIIEKEVKNLS